MRRLRRLWHAAKFEWSLKGLALLAAVVFWAYVRNLQDPVVLRSVVLPLRAVSVPKSLAVLEMSPEWVTVNLRGRTSALDEAKRTMEVYVDLTGQSVGRREVPVMLSSQPPGARVRSLSVQYAVLALDTMATTERRVVAEVAGFPQDGYRVEAPRAEPSSVTLSGPASAVDRVARVVAPVDVTGLSNAVSRQVKVQPRDGKGLSVDKVDCSPGYVQVSVRAVQVSGRPVPVWPDLIGVPPGMRVAAVQVRPATVVVSGDPAGLASVQHLRTQPLDLAGQQGAATYNAPLKVPVGLTAAGPATVEVRVTLAPVGGTPEETGTAGTPAPPQPPQAPAGGAPPAPPAGVEPQGRPEAGTAH
jgi:YbbR domain-containing protein